MKRASIGLLAFALTLVLGMASPTFAQQGGGGGGGGGRGRFGDPAQFRQFMTDRIKEALSPTDDEWKALQPAVEKVVAAGFDERAGMRGPRRNRPADDNGANAQPAQPAQPTSDVQAKAQELQTVLDNKDAKPEDIKAKLTALRAARAKAHDALLAARKELTELLTQRQEALLVEMGVLE
jgi:hypothetical protein